MFSNLSTIFNSCTLVPSYVVIDKLLHVFLKEEFPTRIVDLRQHGQVIPANRVFNEDSQDAFNFPAVSL